MTRSPQLYLQDILESGEKIQQYIANMTFDEFVSNNMAVDAVIRNFEIIGEAVAHIPEDIRSAYPEVPWSEMKGMRNVVAHEYFGVDLKIVWKTVRQSLPPLMTMIRRVIDDIK
jgi:uncharacterized protein with HEPN domain